MQTTKTVVNKELKACCQNPDNLSEPQPTEKPECTFRRCAVCGCRHFTLRAAPGVFSLTGKPTN